MPVFHPAVFANGQSFASGQHFLAANLFFFAGFPTFGGRLVGCGHGAVARNVSFGFFIAMFVRRY